MRDGHETANCANYNLLKEFAQKNKDYPTDAERYLWNFLKSDALGVRFRQQHIVGDYIADFICLKCKLIIEIDGGYHFEQEQIEADEIRTLRINDLGFEVIRFTNEEVLNNVGKVLTIIEERISEILSHEQ